MAGASQRVGGEFAAAGPFGYWWRRHLAHTLHLGYRLNGGRG